MKQFKKESMSLSKIIQPGSPLRFLSQPMLKLFTDNFSLYNTETRGVVKLRQPIVEGKDGDVHRIHDQGKIHRITPDTILNIDLAHMHMDQSPLQFWLRNIKDFASYHIIQERPQLEQFNAMKLRYQDIPVDYLDTEGFEVRGAFMEWETMECKTYRMTMDTVYGEPFTIQFAIAK